MGMRKLQARAQDAGHSFFVVEWNGPLIASRRCCRCGVSVQLHGRGISCSRGRWASGRVVSGVGVRRAAVCPAFSRQPHRVALRSLCEPCDRAAPRDRIAGRGVARPSRARTRSARCGWGRGLPSRARAVCCRVPVRSRGVQRGRAFCGRVALAVRPCGRAVLRS